MGVNPSKRAATEAGSPEPKATGAKQTADAGPAATNGAGAGSDSAPQAEPNQPRATATAHGRVRNTVFLSYSHADKDEDWYQDVQEYLAQLSVGDELQLWDDTSIKGGDDWRAAIEEQLRLAKAAVFLVTPAFLTSKFIAGEEVPKLLERQEMEGLVIHALIAKPCDWELHPIGDFLRSRQLTHGLDTSLEEMEGPERRRRLNELVKQIRSDIGIYRQRNYHHVRAEKILELEEMLGVKVEKEVGSGDSSIVYHAYKGRQEIAVKAMVSRPITEVGQAELREEFEKCRGLQSPVFTRMYELAFENGYCVTTTDWVPGPKLSRRLPVWRRSRVPHVRVTAILTRLAAALSEAHANGLRFLNVHPDKIRLFGDDLEPRLYPIDFSTYVANSAHAHGVFAFPIHVLEFLAPEYIHKPAEREDPLDLKNGSDSAARRMNDLADQYALGMVALAMLEGRPPVQVRSLADVVRLMEFQENPRAYTGGRGVPLEDHPWRREMPGLARIVWRMLEPNPEDRWQDMAEVHAQLRVLRMSEIDVPAHGAEAKASYAGHIMGNDAFYQRFYDKFFAASPEVRAHFDKVDMSRQRTLLDGAIERVLNFRENQVEPTTLTSVARSHRHMGLAPRHFEAFGAAFLDALAEEPAIDRVALDAWQAIMWPAIEYLKREATTRASDETPPAK